MGIDAQDESVSQKVIIPWLPDETLFAFYQVQTEDGQMLTITCDQGDRVPDRNPISYEVKDYKGHRASIVRYPVNIEGAGYAYIATVNPDPLVWHDTRATHVQDFS